METIQTTESAAAQNVDILIVEDNEATSRLIHKTLTRVGLQPLCAFTGAEMIEFAMNHPDTLVLLDYRLPDMSAKQIIQQLGGTYSMPPFIVMTGEGDERIAVEMMKLGARDYIIKDNEFLDFLPQVAKRAITQLATEKELKQTQVKLKDSERMLFSLLSNLPGVAYRSEVHGDRKKNFVSNGSIDLIGYNPADLTTKTAVQYRELIHPDDRNVVSSQIRLALAQNRPFQTIYRLRCANGEDKWVLDKGSGVFSPEGQLMLLEGFVTDITDRIKAEEEIREKNEKLVATQDELRKTNLNLEEKVQERTGEIERLLRRKEEFVAQLAHDLRSPLTPLVALVPMLAQEHEDSPTKEVVDVISRNVQYMKNLVEKTVQLATINASDVELDFRNINLLKVLNDIFTRKSLGLAEGKITVRNRVDRGIKIMANELRIAEVLDNLISNAIKFMPGGGTLTLDASIDDKFITLSVADSGVGLKKEQAERIFEAFYKVDESRHELGSAGLGLTICRRIMQRHGGQIWAESEGVGKGTTFYLRFPIHSRRDEEFVQAVEQALKIEKREDPMAPNEKEAILWEKT